MSRRTRTVSACRSTSELLQQVGPDRANRTRSWRFCRPPPSHLARSGGLAPGEGVEPPSRGSEPRALPVRPSWCLILAPPTGIEPASFCVTDRHPHQRTARARRTNAWWWCAEEDLHLHSRWAATGLQPAELALCAQAGARPPRCCCLACHAYSVFKVRARTSGQKKRGLASPGPLLAP